MAVSQNVGAKVTGKRCEPSHYFLEGLVDRGEYIFANLVTHHVAPP